MSSKASTKEMNTYVRKRDKIAGVIMALKVEYNDWRNELYVVANPSPVQAKDAAESILSKMGINKPKNID